MAMPSELLIEHFASVAKSVLDGWVRPWALAPEQVTLFPTGKGVRVSGRSGLPLCPSRKESSDAAGPVHLLLFLAMLAVSVDREGKGSATWGLNGDV